MDLSEIAQDLYAVRPDEFLAARKESVAAARAAGDDELSKAIGALRKPSAAAAAVNLLARHADELLQEVVDLGDELRAAQEKGDGTLLRTLNEERKALLKRVAAEVAELAKQHDLSFGAAVASGVDDTVKAALADPEAAKAVQAGLLVTALSGAGLGFIDLADSVALPDLELKPKGSRPKQRHLKVVRDASGSDGSRLDTAREALAEANELVQRAESDLGEHQTARDANMTARTKLNNRIDELEAELKELQSEVSEADDAVRDLNRAVVLATRALETARKERSRAKERLDRLT